jgi:hypothetical protein
MVPAPVALAVLVLSAQFLVGFSDAIAISLF